MSEGENERTVADLRAVRLAACAHWTQADYDRNYLETVAKPAIAKGYVHPPTGAYLDWLRAERARRIDLNAQHFERFVGAVTDGKHFRARQRLWASREYFTSEGYFALQDWADWQHTPADLRTFAGAFGHRMRQWGVPVVCSYASRFFIRLRHARYLELTRDEWQMFGFAGCGIAEKLGLSVEWGGFDLWQVPHVGPPPEHSPLLVERHSLAGLRRKYPASLRGR